MPPGNLLAACRGGGHGALGCMRTLWVPCLRLRGHAHRLTDMATQAWPWHPAISHSAKCYGRNVPAASNAHSSIGALDSSGLGTRQPTSTVLPSRSHM